MDHGVHAALASPVRRDLLALLRGAESAPTAAELAGHLALHVTTVRFHLDQLERAGLVAHVADRSHRRGRPATRYEAVDADLAVAREQMIDALALAATGSGSPEENARAAGRQWADLVPLPGGDAVAAVTAVARRLGFDPETADGYLRLRACPFRSAARRTPQVVCQVHLGLVQEIAARADRGGLDVGADVGLLPFVEPEICHLTLTTTPRRS